MLKRMFWFCCLLFWCAHMAFSSTIALVPLDSRPANTYSPQMIGSMAGFKVIMPNSLDYFKRPGDCEATANWLLETDADCYIVSISQLCYGSLISSRISDVSIDKALERLQTLRRLRERNPQKPIYVFDTIQRLAITTTDSYSARYYSAVHNWAILKDEVENLGRLNKKEELEALELQIPYEIIEDYLKARERNHTINKVLIDMLHEGVIDYLVLAQDDASLTGLHRAEREVLRDKIIDLGLGNKATIFPGADEVGVTLVSRFICSFLDMQPTLTVTYRGIDGNKWVAPLEDITFAENIRRHVEAAGGRLAPVGEIKFYVATPGGDSEAFTNLIQEELNTGKKVVVCDVANINRAEPELFRALLSNIEIKNLTGFAGWNTAGNTLGLALGQGIASIAREKLSGEEKQLAEEAHFAYLLSRLAKDYYYKTLLRGSMESWASSRGYDPHNLPLDSLTQVEKYLQERMQPYLSQLYNYFSGQVVGNSYLPKEISWQVHLVWPRFFEIAIEPEIQLADPILGLENN